LLQRHCGCCCCSCGEGGEPQRAHQRVVRDGSGMANGNPGFLSCLCEAHDMFLSCPLSLCSLRNPAVPRRAPLCRYLASTTRQASAAPNPKHQTASSHHPNPNTTPQSPNTHRQTPNTMHQTLLIPLSILCRTAHGYAAGAAVVVAGVCGCRWGPPAMSLLFVFAAGALLSRRIRLFLCRFCCPDRAHALCSGPVVVVNVELKLVFKNFLPLTSQKYTEIGFILFSQP
jgi:hypothetical protein